MSLLGNICANNTVAENKCAVPDSRAEGAVELATAALGDLARLAAMDLRLNYPSLGVSVVASVE